MAQMQWADLSSYENAEMRAVIVDGAVQGLLIDMRAGVDRQALQTIQELGFTRADKTDHQWFTNNVSNTLVSSLIDQLPNAKAVKFQPEHHFAFAESVADLNTYRRAGETVAAHEKPQEEQTEGRPASASGTGDAESRRPTRRRRRHSKSQITDVGHVRGFAMKDLRGNGDALFNAIAQMTQEQITVNIKRNQIWPALEYKKLAEQGYEPGAAYLTKMMRESICLEPGKLSKRRRLRDPIRADVYADTMTRIRDRMQGAKTLDQAVKATREVAEMFWDRDENPLSPGEPSRSARIISPLMQGADGIALERQQRMLDGVVQRRSFWHSIGLGLLEASRVTEDTREEYEDIVNREARLATADNEKWLFLPRNHTLRTGQSNRLSEDEKERRRLDAAAKPPARIPRVPMANMQRYGTQQWRDPNYDVSELDLINRFDLSGIEFGNSETQAERQHLMNVTFDALLDMSDVLNIDPRVIGLGGRLGIGFGSRGRGGPRPACAHFEPINFAINLTRETPSTSGGAGSLAHEWAHALDRSMTSAGMKNWREAMMATDLASGRPNRPGYDRLTVSDQSAINLNEVMAAIRYAPYPAGEQMLTRSEERNTRQLKRAAQNTAIMRDLGKNHHVDVALKDPPDNVKDGIVSAVDTTLGDHWSMGNEFEGVQEKCRDAAHAELGLASRMLSDAEIAELDVAIADYAEDRWRNYDDFTASDLVACQDDETRRQWILTSGPEAWQQRMKAAESRLKTQLRDTTPREMSEMANVARMMDEDLNRSYWYQDKEMFARSFECYIKQEMVRREARNDFLVAYHKPKNDNGVVYASVYPTGLHMDQVNVAMNKMFTEFQSMEQETESPVLEGKGKSVILYSLDGDSITGATPSRLRADMVCRDIEDMVGDAVDIQLKASLGHTGGYHRIAGQYDEGKRLLKIAANSSDPEAAGYHEALHAAYDALFTDNERHTVQTAFMPGGRHHKALEDALVNDEKFHIVEQVRSNPKEAAAYGFQYWMKGELNVKPESRVGKAMARIKDFIEATRNLVRKHGFNNANDVLTQLASGGMKNREPRPTIHEWMQAGERDAPHHKPESVHSTQPDGKSMARQANGASVAAKAHERSREDAERAENPVVADSAQPDSVSVGIPEFADDMPIDELAVQREKRRHQTENGGISPEM